ncbi:MAG: MerR family transcriptional regulator [Clostridia bacterium]|nr:MerR family transcriptional regulator [Clostridia bacterium]
MSQYTTGELAKLAGVSVRTVQYYDSRGILSPEQRSEGGRRLYTDDDLNRLKLICFLRGLDLPIQKIGEILEAPEGENTISLLLEQQARALNEDIAQKQMQLKQTQGLIDALRALARSTPESLNDAARIMRNKSKLRRIHGMMLVVGIPLDGIEIASLVYGIRTGCWLPFAIGMAVAIVFSGALFEWWWRSVEYLCPECHTRFQPKRMQAFIGSHTPKTRKLFCPHGQRKLWCVEVARE